VSAPPAHAGGTDSAPIGAPLPDTAYQQLSMKHRDRYLDEFEFRFNNRHSPYLFRDTLLRLPVSSNLEYTELTKEKAA
jgi:hypothetical protein